MICSIDIFSLEIIVLHQLALDTSKMKHTVRLLSSQKLHLQELKVKVSK